MQLTAHGDNPSVSLALLRLPPSLAQGGLLGAYKQGSPVQGELAPKVTEGLYTGQRTASPFGMQHLIRLVPRP